MRGVGIRGHSGLPLCHLISQAMRKIPPSAEVPQAAEGADLFALFCEAQTQRDCLV